jgi:predicted O-methyltransferase YrrM
MAAATATPVTQALREAPADLHAGGSHWGLAWSALAWLEQSVQPEWATLEIGSGSSTIVLAAAGAEHEAVTPDGGERDAIEAQCRALGIDASHVTFHIGLSQDVLPRWQPRPLDLALIDGAHGFPYPVLDWWYLAPHVKIGGHVLLDDAYLPAVAAIVDFVRASPAWRLEPAVSFRTAHAVKVSDEAPPFDAGSEASHGKMRFSYLPPHRRLVASARQRVFSTAVGIRAVEKARELRLNRARGGSASPPAGPADE